MEGSLGAGRSLEGGWTESLGGAAVPAEGEAGGGVLGTPGIGPAGRRLGCAAPSWRGPGRRAALTAAARRRRCSDPGSARPWESPAFGAGGFHAPRSELGVLEKPGHHEVRGGAVGRLQQGTGGSVLPIFIFCYAN